MEDSKVDINQASWMAAAGIHMRLSEVTQLTDEKDTERVESDPKKGEGTSRYAWVSVWGAGWL